MFLNQSRRDAPDAIKFITFGDAFGFNSKTD
jgi:hypothetical protein